MKYFPLFLIFIFSISAQAQGSTAFQIPRTEVVDITDAQSGRIYPIFIKLPRSYNKNKQQRYPVIYLTDAKYSFQIVSGATRYPMNIGKMEEAIIVGISYSKGSKGSSSRIRDFTHQVDPSWQNQTGEAKQHAEFINNSIFTYIEKRYRTNDSRTYVGNSLGGLLGAYILFTKPEMFNNYVLGSPSIWFKDDHILSINNKVNTRNHKVFIAVGAQERPEYHNNRINMVEGAQALKNKIDSELLPNTEVNFLAIPGANHQTAFPTTAIQGLYWLFKTTE